MVLLPFLLLLEMSIPHFSFCFFRAQPSENTSKRERENSLVENDTEILELLLWHHASFQAKNKTKIPCRTRSGHCAAGMQNVNNGHIKIFIVISKKMVFLLSRAPHPARDALFPRNNLVCKLRMFSHGISFIYYTPVLSVVASAAA